MIPFLIALALFGNGYQLQMKFEHCKKQEFKGEYCEVQKMLHEAPEKFKGEK
jgi:hypothetical protein